MLEALFFLNDDQASVVELKRLLLILYGIFLFWLIFSNVFRNAIKKSQLKGFFEFHLLSFPAVVFIGFAYKLAHSKFLLLALWPHVALMLLMLLFCILDWRKKSFKAPHCT